jgi:hypothetical protein
MTERGTRQNRAASESKIANENKCPSVKSAEPKMRLRGESVDCPRDKIMLRGNRNHACRFEKRKNCFANVDFLIFFPLSGKIDAPISHELSPPDRFDDYSRTLRLIGSAQVVTNSLEDVARRPNQ